jgi:hypothetical protein
MTGISSQSLCAEADFRCLGVKAPNIGEGGKVFFYSEREDMICIGRIFSGLISFESIFGVQATGASHLNNSDIAAQGEL